MNGLPIEFELETKCDHDRKRIMKILEVVWLHVEDNHLIENEWITELSTLLKKYNN